MENAGGPRLGISASPHRPQRVPTKAENKCQTPEFLTRQAYLASAQDTLFISFRFYLQPMIRFYLQPMKSLDRLRAYTIEAKAESPQSRETMLGPMLGGLLEDRFKLKTHLETRVVPDL